MYVERYVGPEAGASALSEPAADGLKSLIEVALEISKLKEFLGRDKPTVITVSIETFFRVSWRAYNYLHSNLLTKIKDNVIYITQDDVYSNK